jgi:glycosyltransferase involved in cell wall biosynthesis
MNCNNPLISIIIPVYNTEKYVFHCIDSVLSQTYLNIEVIIINDGSTDKSLGIINTLCKIDKRIVLINKKNNAGVSSARNDGLDCATGKYVMFVDSDDYISENTAIEKIYRLLAANIDSDVALLKKVHNKNTMVNIDSRLIGDMLLRESLNSLWDKVYRLEIIKDNGIRFSPEIKMGEDLLFNFKYFNNSKKLLCINEEFYFYRIDNINSATKKYITNKYSQLMSVNDEVVRWGVQNNDNYIINAAKYIRIKNVISCIKDLTHKNCPLNRISKTIKMNGYKNQNHTIIVKKYGIKYYLLSIIYSILSAGAIYRLVRLLYERRAM